MTRRSTELLDSIDFAVAPAVKQFRAHPHAPMSTVASVEIYHELNVNTSRMAYWLGLMSDVVCEDGAVLRYKVKPPLQFMNEMPMLPRSTPVDETRGLFGPLTAAQAEDMLEIAKALAINRYSAWMLHNACASLNNELKDGAVVSDLKPATRPLSSRSSGIRLATLNGVACGS